MKGKSASTGYLLIAVLVVLITLVISSIAKNFFKEEPKASPRVEHVIEKPPTNNQTEKPSKQQAPIVWEGIM